MGELTTEERESLAEVERQHRPADDWKCECGSDCFGGSAAYSTQLFVAHYLDEMGAAVERILAVRRESLAERVKALAAGIRCAHVHQQPEGVTKAVSCVNCQSWASSIAMPLLRALLDPSETP